MIDCQLFYDSLTRNGVGFFTGVPDSLLKDICAYITDHVPAEEHIITPNEGNAIALATGYHLASKGVPLVYMQNSGFGNCINPLTSLTDPEVYAIPMVLLIGWRGEPGVKDEPQHVKMGRVNPALLEALEIPYEILPVEAEDALQTVARVVALAKEKSAPVALLVRKDTFSKYKLQKSAQNAIANLKREQAIQEVLKRLPENARVVGTTGKISREVYEYRDIEKTSHDRDFLTVGAMGHASHITLGLALGQPDKLVVCFDGDGAALMHMGGFASAGVYGPENFRHIIFNNAAHESVGGQPTVGDQISFTDIAKACGYKSVSRIEKGEELNGQLDAFLKQSGPSLLEIMVEKGSRDDLIRPKTTPIENKRVLMEAL